MPDGTIQKKSDAVSVLPQTAHPENGDGQSGYSVNKVDGIVDQPVRMKLLEIERASESEILSAFST